MIKAGIREVRQNLSELIEAVRKGREILITDRGKPVARLVPALSDKTLAFPSRQAFRHSMPMLQRELSTAIIEDREDRL
jgi:prevent-host-death family protein